MRWANKRERRNRAANRAYQACATITGPLAPAPDGDYTVRFRKVGSAGTKAVLALIMTFNVVAGLALVGWKATSERANGYTSPWENMFGYWKLR